MGAKEVTEDVAINASLESSRVGWMVPGTLDMTERPQGWLRELRMKRTRTTRPQQRQGRGRRIEIDDETRKKLDLIPPSLRDKLGIRI